MLVCQNGDILQIIEGGSNFQRKPKPKIDGDWRMNFVGWENKDRKTQIYSKGSSTRTPKKVYFTTGKKTGSDCH